MSAKYDAFLLSGLASGTPASSPNWLRAFIYAPINSGDGRLGGRDGGRDSCAHAPDSHAPTNSGTPWDSNVRFCALAFRRPLAQ